MSHVATSISVRRGRPDDAETLAKLHVAVWRATYASLAPEDALTVLDEAKRRPYWVAALSVGDPGQGVWVADQGNAILGVVSAGRSDNPAFGGRAEIKHLYVAGTAQGQGLGQRLLKAVHMECRAAGCSGVALAVVQQNTLAREFYRKMGGLEIGAFLDPGPLWRSQNILVAWDYS